MWRTQGGEDRWRWEVGGAEQVPEGDPGEEHWAHTKCRKCSSLESSACLLRVGEDKSTQKLIQQGGTGPQSMWEDRSDR